jgi:hypothetical protein
MPWSIVIPNSPRNLNHGSRTRALEASNPIPPTEKWLLQDSDIRLDKNRRLANCSGWNDVLGHHP